MQNKSKKNITRELFYFFSLLIIVFIGFEIIWPGSVLVYLNLNYVFILWAVSFFLWLLL